MKQIVWEDEKNISKERRVKTEDENDASELMRSKEKLKISKTFQRYNFKFSSFSVN